MKSTQLTTILATTALTITLAGCGEDDEPTVQNPPAAEETSATEAPEEAPTTQAPAEPSDQAPTSEAPTSGDAPSEDAPSEDADPTDGGGDGDLPTDPTAYADLFVQAWADQDEALLEQLAAEGVLASMESWEGQGWARGEVRQEAHGAVVIEYADQEQMHVELWVQEGITQNGEPHGIVSASVSEGSLPPPDTIEDYASAFVEAAGGDAAQRAIVEKLGTPEAAAEAQDWIGDYTWGEPSVSDGDDAGTARVTFTSDDGVELVLLLDRELVESASEDGVLSAERDGGGQS